MWVPLGLQAMWGLGVILVLLALMVRRDPPVHKAMWGLGVMQDP